MIANGIPVNNNVVDIRKLNPFRKSGIQITGRIVMAAEIWDIAISSPDRIKYIGALMRKVGIWGELNLDRVADLDSINPIFRGIVTPVNPFLFQGVRSTGRVEIAAGLWELATMSDFAFESTMRILGEVCIWRELNIPIVFAE